MIPHSVGWEQDIKLLILGLLGTIRQRNASVKTVMTSVMTWGNSSQPIDGGRHISALGDECTEGFSICLANGEIFRVLTVAVHVITVSTACLARMFWRVARLSPGFDYSSAHCMETSCAIHPTLGNLIICAL